MSRAPPLSPPTGLRRQRVGRGRLQPVAEDGQDTSPGPPAHVRPSSPVAKRRALPIRRRAAAVPDATVTGSTPCAAARPTPEAVALPSLEVVPASLILARAPPLTPVGVAPSFLRAALLLPPSAPHCGGASLALANVVTTGVSCETPVAAIMCTQKLIIRHDAPDTTLGVRYERAVGRPSATPPSRTI